MCPTNEAVERLEQLRRGRAMDRRVRVAPRPGALAYLSRKQHGRTQQPGAVAQAEDTSGFQRSQSHPGPLEGLWRTDLLPSPPRSACRGELSSAVKKRTAKKPELICHSQWALKMAQGRRGRPVQGKSSVWCGRLAWHFQAGKTPAPQKSRSSHFPTDPFGLVPMVKQVGV